MSLTQYVIEQRFDVPPARLYAAFTDPALLRRWIWGRDAPGVEVEIDPRVNGTITVSMPMKGEDGEVTTRVAMRGIYLELAPGARVVHTVHWDASVGYNAPGMSPLDEVLAITIRPDDDGAHLTYTHLGIPDDGMSAKEHERSVRVTLRDLAQILVD